MITSEEVRRIARLAMLELKDEDVDRFAAQFNDILQYMEEINALDLSDQEAAFHITELKNVFRDDELKPSTDREEILKNAPEEAEGFFKVPRVI